MEQVDRISQLPEPILQHILSFLDIKHIVQASSLSKTWQQAWNTFPVLDFNSSFFCRKNRKSIDFIERTLSARCRQMISLKKLKLELNFCYKGFESALNRWIGYAIDAIVEDLTISDCSYWDGRQNQKLPPNVLSARSVAVLNLTGCELELTHHNFPLLSTLKSVSLFNVLADENSIQCLVNRCPLIEELSCSYCNGFKALHLSGTLATKLKRIILDGNELQSVKMEALNFDLLWIDGLVSYLDIDMLTCRNLGRLKVFKIRATELFIHVLLSKFAGKNSKGLEHKEFLGCEYADFIGVDIDGPCFDSFCFSQGIISFSPENLLTLSSVKLHWMVSNIDFFLPTKFVDAFMSKFSHCDLFSQTKNKNVVPRELGGTTSSPSRSIEELNFSIDNKLESCEILQVVEVLLWICPRVEKLCIKSTGISLTFQFSYGRPSNEGEACPCSNSIPVAYWQHCMKSVKVIEKNGSIETSSKLASSESYFFEENIWENIESLVRTLIHKRREQDERDRNLEEEEIRSHKKFIYELHIVEYLPVGGEYQLI